MMLAVLTAAAAVVLGAASSFHLRVDQARTALSDGRMQMAQGESGAAISTFERGLAVTRELLFHRDLADELEFQLRLAERARTEADRAAAARELHRLADRARFLYGMDRFPSQGLRDLEASCRAFWRDRHRVVEHLRVATDNPLPPAVRDDLLDLAICWADLQVSLAPRNGTEARRRALTVLAQAEALVGPSPVLDAERMLRGEPRGYPPDFTVGIRKTAWEHYALARCLLRSGNLTRAAEEAERAVGLEPQGLWPNFYQGLCAYRQGRYADAVLAYSVCIGSASEAAACFYNRAAALAALGRTDQALRDLDQALRVDPTLAVAALNRGLLRLRAKQSAAAIADLQRAGALGADPVVVAFALALAELSRARPAAALDRLRRAFRHNSDPRPTD
jgi:tetratricopeptide (TPR) repeat protein